MPGWDVAVQTMEKGERASIICSPQYAYGEAGAPPKIPPGASLECELELLDWEDVAARYSEYARPGETHEERMERWEQEIESGTSPIKEDVGPQPGIRTVTADEVTKGKMVDVNDPQVRRAAARQLVCGQGEGYTYLEKGAFLDLYVTVPEGTRAEKGAFLDLYVTVPQGTRAANEKGAFLDLYVTVPEGTRAADVLCDIAPRRLSLRITAQPDAPPLTILEGTLHGRVALDGSYWVMSEVAPEAYDELRSDVGFGLTARGAFVQVYLEKLPPDDTIWPDVFAE
ncbi:hypothetical protein JKP88DRAFT_354553 [Tribonema minus]|uniref:peptidylprolyl isomerase n=1 Tax=Tribonema minus TaxID=303371 RepID=A0A835YYM1_9STRA|nr:hypothetical protein JKP88DRAFT_354553 [Tribonema minus]